MTRPRVLVTGFGPFPGAPENPSARLAEALGAMAFPGCDLHAEILPTEWEAVAALAPELHARLQPDVMIHFGLCQRAIGFRIERSAYNRIAPRADARAALPTARQIMAQGPERLDTRVPAAKVAAHLSARGVPAASSRSGGRYLCNFLYYHSLAWAAQQQVAPLALFVHIPKAASHGGPIGEAALLQGAQEVVRFVLAFAETQPVASPLDVDRPLIGREGGKLSTQNKLLIPLPSPPPEGGRESAPDASEE